MSNNKNKRPIKMIGTFAYAIAFPGTLLAIILIGTIILSIFYVLTSNISFIIALGIYFGILTIAYIVLCVYIVRSLYGAYYHGLFEVTNENLKKLSNNVIDLNNYPSVNIKEFKELNNNIDDIKAKLDNALLITYRPDFSHVPLVYVDEDKRLITYDSFTAQLKNLIFLSQSFRNIIIDVYYDLGDQQFTAENKEYLLDLFNDAFIDYDRSLFTFRDSGNSLLIYLPVIDSLSRIHEKLRQMMGECSVSIRTLDGITNVPAKFAIVAYPYSDVDELMSDLRYAKRQGKEINFFLPERIKDNEDKKMMMHTSMNINYMSKLLSLLSNLNYNFLNIDHDKKIIQELLMNLSNYLGIDEGGIVLLDETVKTYSLYVSSAKESIFNKQKYISEDFIASLDKSCDIDSSYYFSKRSHANDDFGRHLDYLGLTSGFVYSLRKDKGSYGFIYFLNQQRDLAIDAYLRESLFVICLRLSHYFDILSKNQEIDLYQNETEYILSMSKYGLYKVDDETYDIKSYSKNLEKIFPGLKKGGPCYKALFGLDKPCWNCPMKTFKKRTVDQPHFGTYELSLTVNDRKSHVRTLLVEPVSDEALTGDLFNKDLLINSYRALFEAIKNSYYSSGRGYVLLLSFDNLETFIDNQGSEGCLFVLRAFIHELKNKLMTDEFYYYNNKTVALVFHNIGHADLISKCEMIYDISKKHYFDDGSEDSIKITYLSLGWPRGYANANDFMRHMVDYYQSNKFERNKDFIYFADYAISRSASKREFIISVIEDEFSGHTSNSVSLQPIVRARDQKIFGAEILLRINDVYRNVMFNAEEISRIAEQENKTSLITESLINFIGSMYQEYGDNVFKINNFNRVCINIDQTYLRDENLITSVVELNHRYNLPDYFLSFEIPEDVISNNTVEIQRLARDLASYHIMFSCDRYTGKHVSIEKLKSLGFKEVKLTRELIAKIDQDPMKLEEVKDILNLAKDYGLYASVVGVENQTQFSLLRDIDPNIGVQGYYFYKPLPRSELITALISHNR